MRRYLYGNKSILVPHMKSKAFNRVELSAILSLIEIIPIDNGKLKKVSMQRFLSKTMRIILMKRP
jgi:hypothetical protein